MNYKNATLMAAITPATASLRLTKNSVKFGLVTQEDTARVCARKRQNSRPGGLTPGLLRINVKNLPV